jgi:lysozyme
MSDYKDLDEFGFEPIEEINDEELSDFGFEPELEIPQQEIEPEEMGALEAAVTGLGQGASFGLTPIVAGVTGAAGEAIEDIGDVLGLTTDAQLKEEGFKVKDDYEGLQGLVDAYYAQRDRQRAQEEKAFEDQPVANIAGNIAGGLTSMGGAAKATGALGKLLPKAESVKGLSTLGKAGVAAREGAKAGGLVGFGAGEGKLLEGELAKTAKETAGTAIGGAAFGGGLSLGGSALKKGGELIAETPFAKNIGLGFEAGQRGINISDDKQITDFVRKTTSDIRKSISKNFKGASKKQILEQADELGIRVAAGESVDDVINEIKESGAFGKKAQKELNQFVEDLRNLSVADDVARDKLRKKLEQQAAKKLSKAERQGEMFRKRDEFESTFDELTPTEQEGSVLGIEDIVDRPYEQPRKILTQGTLTESEVPMKQYDLDSLKLSELDEIISKVGTRAYEGTDDAAVPYAKQLYASLRELSNDAMQESSLPEKNKKLKALFDGLESLDIKPKDFFSSRETIQDAVENKIQSKLIASPLSTSDNKMKNFLKYLARADEDLARNITKESDFASDIAKFAKQSEGEGSVSLKAAAGPIQKILAKVGNIAGSGVKSVANTKKQALDGLRNMTPEDVLELGTMMSEKYGENASSFINQLNNAVNSPGQRKNALMYGIYQQPAFRKMLEGLGRNIVGEDEDVQEVGNNENVNDFFNADDSVELFKKKVENTREPQGNLVELPEETEKEITKNEGYRSQVYKDSLGKDTIGIGHLLTDEEKRTGKIYGIDFTDGLTKDEAREILYQDYMKASKGADSVLDMYDIDKEDLTESQLNAINEMVFQLGPQGASKFKNTFNLIKQGEFEEAAKEAEDSLWFKQTPNRVRNFQKNIIK